MFVPGPGAEAVRPVMVRRFDPLSPPGSVNLVPAAS